MRIGIILGSAAIILLTASASAIDPETTALLLKPWETVQCDGPEVAKAEAEGLDPYTHTWVDPEHPEMTVTVHLLCLESVGDIGPLTDCTSTGYTWTGWKWNTVENYRVDATGSGIAASTAVSRFQTSGDTWDAQVAANIYGSVSSGGSHSSIPVFDGFNQFGWNNLAATTIASTWTWSSGGVASESDASYNTDFAWSSSGEAGKMDLQNIATHELGHTFGMGHSSASSCLTMYPSGSLGETQKRTLGDGDINGIKARYP